MSTKTRKTNPLPPIAPCPCGKPKCCGHVANAVYGLWRVVTDCGFAGPVCHTPRTAILAWNRRCDAKKTWRCFHCNEVFDDPKKARAHFGEWEGDGEISATPMCKMPESEVREMEKELRRYHEEDTEMHRKIGAMEAEHHLALQREEEKGYARGIRDAKKLSAPDAEAERRGAMAAVEFLRGQTGPMMAVAAMRLLGAIERGEVMPAKPEPWIVSTPGVMAGKPRVRGTRITAETLQSAAREWTSQQILEQYPGLTAEGLAAALAYEMPQKKARKR